MLKEIFNSSNRKKKIFSNTFSKSMIWKIAKNPHGLVRYSKCNFNYAKTVFKGREAEPVGKSITRS